MAALGTAAVDCPRCDDKIVVTLEAGEAETLKPGAKSVTVPVRIVDLADRFAEHYQTAGHTTPAQPAVIKANAVTAGAITEAERRLADARRQQHAAAKSNAAHPGHL